MERSTYKNIQEWKEYWYLHNTRIIPPGFWPASVCFNFYFKPLKINRIGSHNIMEGAQQNGGVIHNRKEI